MSDLKHCHQPQLSPHVTLFLLQLALLQLLEQQDKLEQQQIAARHADQERKRVLEVQDNIMTQMTAVNPARFLFNRVIHNLRLESCSGIESVRRVSEPPPNTKVNPLITRWLRFDGPVITVFEHLNPSGLRHIMTVTML